jgi:hypothetical protein
MGQKSAYRLPGSEKPRSVAKGPHPKILAADVDIKSSDFFYTHGYSIFTLMPFPSRCNGAGKNSARMGRDSAN